ncbi:MAG: prephenate dehydrogenase [Verrucomicrobiota bacterium JB025]|nr:prephenate dehydrogenase/arogenate dehydrogenase family protein [Verrucomicrobiota bacterium JB025]
MSADFTNVTILGGGLLGGSLALALEPSATNTRLWARRPATVDEARTLGINATADLADAVRAADLLVLSVPVGAMPDLLTRAIAAGLPASCLVTDVGSVKQTPHQTLAPLLAAHGSPFIGSHPMAGSERTGLAATSADLFQNAACLLTNDNQAPRPLADALDRFWQSVGCRTSWTSAAEHDALVARISHLPHLIAASAARICLEKPDHGEFGGGGLRDTTRVAAGHTGMWAEILTENSAAITGPLRQTIADLTEILHILETPDQVAAQTWLDKAKQLRDTLPPQR